MQKIAIIIPCYNEERRLKESSLLELLNDNSVTLYLANDGSRDKTLDIITAFSLQNPERCFVLNYTENSGKANTIFKAVNEVLSINVYDYIGYFDADFSTPADEVLRILKELQIKKYPLIFGSRVLLLNSNINRKWQRHIIGRVIITLINFKFKLGVYDTQCGAKIFSKEIIPIAFSRPFFTSWLFDVEVFIRLKKENQLAQACEFPLKEWRDIEGSKLSWKTSFKIIKELYLLNKNYK